MAPPCRPLAHARASGAISKNPQRYRQRAEPLVTDPVGEPPKWLTAPQRAAWDDMAHRMPWLNRSHRGITGIAAILQSKMIDGLLGIPGMQLLRVTLGQMGATPASAQHAVMPAPVDDDPAEAYFR